MFVINLNIRRISNEANKQNGSGLLVSKDRKMGGVTSLAVLFFPVSALAVTYGVKNTDGNSEYSDGIVSGYDYGIFSNSSTTKASLTTETILINADKTGVYALTKGTATVGASGITDGISISVGSSDSPLKSNGYITQSTSGGTVNLSSNSATLSLYTTTSAYGIQTGSASIGNHGSSYTNFSIDSLLNITVSSLSGDAYAIRTQLTGITDIQADNIQIIVSSDSDSKSAYGLKTMDRLQLSLSL